MGEDGPEVEAISAVTLVTPDMAPSVGFYEALGFPLLCGGAEAAFTSFAVGAGCLNLQAAAWSRRDDGAWGRIVFWVADVDAVHERALAAGYSPVTTPTDAPWGERYFHITDPGGHEPSFARPVAV